MTNIQPVVFPILGTASKLQVIVLGFATNAKTCNTYYSLLTEDNKRVTEGNYELTEQEFTQWGVDNTFIDNCVANYLEVKII